jgi:flagellar hook-length control protein FliK
MQLTPKKGISQANNQPKEKGSKNTGIKKEFAALLAGMSGNNPAYSPNVPEAGQLRPPLEIQLNKKTENRYTPTLMSQLSDISSSPAKSKDYLATFDHTAGSVSSNELTTLMKHEKKYGTAKATGRENLYSGKNTPALALQTDQTKFHPVKNSIVPAPSADQVLKGKVPQAMADNGLGPSLYVEKGSGSGVSNALKSPKNITPAQNESVSVQKNLSQISSQQACTPVKASLSNSAAISILQDLIVKATLVSHADQKSDNIRGDKQEGGILQVKEKEVKKDSALLDRSNTEHLQTKSSQQARGENSTSSTEDLESRVRPQDATKISINDTDKLETIKGRSATAVCNEYLALDKGGVNELQVSIQSQKAVPMTEARFQQQIVDYITTQLSQLTNHGTHRATIVLDPPYLGNLEVEIRVQGSQVKTIFVASTELVKTLLESNMNDLKQSFTEAGFQQGEASVFLRQNNSDNSTERDKTNTHSDSSLISIDEENEKHAPPETIIGQEHYLINLQA